jgi:hypothetical protein
MMRIELEAGDATAFMGAGAGADPHVSTRLERDGLAWEKC